MSATRLFVYGTLAPGRRNHHILQDLAGSWSAASVRGRLVNSGWGAQLGFPGIVLDDTARNVSGFLFESVDLASHWDRLDAFEGNEYRRTQTVVESVNGESVTASIYVLAESPSRLAD